MQTSYHLWWRKVIMKCIFSPNSAATVCMFAYGTRKCTNIKYVLYETVVISKPWLSERENKQKNTFVQLILHINIWFMELFYSSCANWVVNCLTAPNWGMWWPPPQPWLIIICLAITLRLPVRPGWERWAYTVTCCYISVSLWCQEWTVRLATYSVAPMRLGDQDVPAASHR